MKNQKGQTALEYLMTYGWAILIILVVGGVLYYYGVFSPSTLVGESKTGFSKVDVTDWTVDSTNDNLKLMLENRAGVDINVTNVKVKAGDATTFTGTTQSPEVNIGAGDRSNFITGIGTGSSFDSGDAYQMDVVIEYERTDAPGTTLSSTGKLAGKAS